MSYNLISQKGKNTMEVGVFSYKKDAIIIKGAATGDELNTVEHIIPNTQLFVEPRKHSLIQNASLPLPKNNNFIATHLAIITNFNNFMSERAFLDFLNNSELFIKIDSKELEPIELFHFYVPQKASELPKLGQFVTIPVPIEFDDQSNYHVEIRTYPESKLYGINDTNGAMYFGSGIIDSQNSPVAYLKTVFLGKLDRP